MPAPRVEQGTIDELVPHPDRPGERLGPGLDGTLAAVALQLAADVDPQEHQRQLAVYRAVECVTAIGDPLSDGLERYQSCVEFISARLVGTHAALSARRGPRSRRAAVSVSERMTDTPA